MKTTSTQTWTITFARCDHSSDERYVVPVTATNEQNAHGAAWEILVDRFADRPEIDVNTTYAILRCTQGAAL